MKKLTTAALVLLGSFIAMAGELPLNSERGTAQLTNGATIRLTDPTFPFEVPAQDFSVKRTNRVYLTYRRDKLSDVPSNGYWKMEVDYTIGAFGGSPEPLKTLKVSFAPNQFVYDDKIVHTAGYNDAVLTIAAVRAWHSTDGNNFNPVANPSASPLIPPDIYFGLYTVTEKYRDLNVSTLPVLNFNPATQEVTWNFIEGAEEYDLEWTHIDAMDVPPAFVNPSDPFTYKEGTRVTTSDNHYRLDLTYPSGTLYFRVRAVGRFIKDFPAGVMNDYTFPKNGNWSYNNASSIPLTYVISNSFESGKNWSYVISFAEEGKHKTALSYYDEGLRMRQAATNISSDNTVLVAENKYDSEGRPVVAILPVPVNGNGLNFRPAFNKNVNSLVFEKGNFENGASDPMGTTSGTGQYYSSSNPFLNSDPFARYIPASGSVGNNSESFAYSQVEYMPDNTGRPRRQSGVGPDHRLGSGHETKFYFGTPNSTELHRMFGTNVGIASHYKKNMVLDANGQASISYIDQEGRVVATCLAGPSPANLIALDDNQQQTITASLNGNNIIDKQNNTSISLSRILNVPNVSGGSNPYTFTYDMSGVIYRNQFTLNTKPASPPSMPVDICTDCEYDLSISVTDPDGLVVPITDPSTQQPVNELTRHFSNPNNPDCNNNQYNTGTLSFNLNFDKTGEYTVTKKLVLSESGLDAKINNAINASGLGPAFLAGLKQTLLNQIDFSQCDITCEQHCRTIVKQAHPEWPENSQQFLDAVIACIEDPVTGCYAEGFKGDDEEPTDECSAILEQMKRDVSPGGFHYQETHLTGLINIIGFWRRVEILMGNSTIVLKDEDGNTLAPQPTLASVMDPATFQLQWADDLVKAHREYCHYTACIDNRASTNFDLKMALVKGWNNASASGYANTINANDAVTCTSPSTLPSVADPFLSNRPSNIVNWFTAQLTDNPKFVNIVSAQNSLWCWVQDASNGVYGASFPFIDENKWDLFRGQYLNLKQQAIMYQKLADNCPYYGDDNAIVKPPLIVTSQLDFNNQFDKLYNQLTLPCNSQCNNNVELWMKKLDTQCGINATNYAQADIDIIRSNLVDFCMSNCNLANPMGIITLELYNANTNTFLNNVKNKIQSLVPAPSCGAETLAIPSPYGGNCTQTTYIKTFISPACFTDLLSFFNQELFTRNFVTCADNLKFSDFVSLYPTLDPNACSITQNKEAVRILDDGSIKLGPASDPNCEDNEECRIYFYKESPVNSGNGVLVNASNVIAVLNPVHTFPSITSLTPPPFSPSVTAKGSVLLKLDDGSEVSAVIYISTPCSGLFSLSGGDQVTTQCIEDSLKTTFDTIINFDVVKENCHARLIAESDLKAEKIYKSILDKFRSNFIANYRANCMGNQTEDFRYSYTTREYHYTLYYYDQAGNLVQTVPPQGCHLIPYPSAAFNNSGEYLPASGIEPLHTYLSKYTFNSLDLLLTQVTPDGGTTTFHYDTKGRLRFSQNDRQVPLNSSYSYTKYDERGRIKEVGESDYFFSQQLPEGGSVQTYFYQSMDDQNWPHALRTQVTKTFYDEPLPGNNANAIFSPATPRNLRNRVSASTYEDSDEDTPDNNTYLAASHYSYDVHGNVNFLAQENTALAPLNQQFKTIEYFYDLVSNNVKLVKYQHGQPDRFYHHYEYDADNRLTNAYSGSFQLERLGVHTLASLSGAEDWEQDAKYYYYKHGPLARMETGQDKVQAMDYAYTTQGWIKGVNAATLDPLRDMGKDGYVPPGGAGGVNLLVARDAMGYTLGYFNNGTTSNDYRQVINSGPGPDNFLADASVLNTSGDDLFNGNIKEMATALMKPNTGAAPSSIDLMLRHFKYDQLNRIKTANAFVSANTGSYAPATNNNDYFERFIYDRNGNITEAERNGLSSNPAGQQMDLFTYNYGITNTNKLTSVNDSRPSGNYTIDIDNQTDPDNYQYDPIGNLIKDKAEEIETIEWTVYGKIKTITRNNTSNKPDLEFSYDASGNRIVKISKPRVNGILSNQSQWTSTYYVRDAQGNVMAVYERAFAPHQTSGLETQYADLLKLKEKHIFGSNRIGLKQEDKPTGGHIYQTVNGVFTYDGDGRLTQPYTDIGDYPIDPEPENSSRTVGFKMYELSNHLGNICVTVTDRKLAVADAINTTQAAYYLGDVVSSTDYYAFGSEMPGRNFSSNSYRYGFGGQEKTDEVSGSGNSYAAEFWQYDTRLGRRWNIDPLAHRTPWMCPYAAFNNNPILLIDPLGLSSINPNEVKETSIPNDPSQDHYAFPTEMDWGKEAGDYVVGLSWKTSDYQTFSMPAAPDPSTKPSAIDWSTNPTMQVLMNKYIQAAEWSAAYNNGQLRLGDYFPEFASQTLPTDFATFGTNPGGTSQAQIDFTGLSENDVINVFSMQAFTIGTIGVGTPGAPPMPIGSTLLSQTSIGYNIISGPNIGSALNVNVTEVSTVVSNTPMPGGGFVQTTTETTNYLRVVGKIGTQINHGAAYGDRLTQWGKIEASYLYNNSVSTSRTIPLNTRAQYGGQYKVTVW